MDKKVCSKCNQTLPIDNFYFKNKSKGYRKSSCKECDKAYYEANKEKFAEKKKAYSEAKKEKQKAYSKAYYEANKEKLAKQNKAYREANKEKIVEKNKAYYEANKERMKAYCEANKEKVLEKKKLYKRRRRVKDPLFKLRTNYSKSCRQAFYSINKKKNNSSLKLLGLKTWQQLAEHLSKQFYNHPETGEEMTFNNHGFYGWHIDHIIPLSTAETEEDIIKLCHYTNLQPMWAEQNLSKSNKILDK